MRRFTSVFVSSRRTDKPGAPSTTSSNEDTVPSGDSQTRKKRSRVFNSLSRKASPTTASLSLLPLVAGNLATSSSSSSSGSTTLRTPEDDCLTRTPSKKSNWKLWLGGKKSPGSDDVEETKHPSWRLSPQLPQLPNADPSNEIDDASSQSEDEYGRPEGIHYQTYSSQQIATARTNARTMIRNSLIHKPTSPPLLQLPDAIPFPHSCRNHRHLSRQETMESELHKKSLLARLDSLSRSAALSIAPLASEKVVPKPHIIHRNLQDDFFPSANSVTLHSNALSNWLSRPCYEDRVRVWTREDSGVIACTRIPGSQLGVAALEFSETLELLAATLPESEDAETDIQFDPALELTLPASAFNLDPPAIQIQALELEPWSLPSDFSLSGSPPVEPSPPPQSSSPPLLVTSPEVSPEPQPNQSKSSECATVGESVPKRGVRFADDDGKDDQIPLGYVLRIRKNKEQKAQFLREERERRAREAQREVQNRRVVTMPPHETRVSRAVAPQQRAVPSRAMSPQQAARPQQPGGRSQIMNEEERLRREAERTEMEKLRRARELERKQAEERQRAYVEELQATRARREAARAGHLQSLSSSARVLDRDRSGSRDSMHTSLRGLSTSHRHAPELILPTSPFDGSPASSVPATPGSQYSFSRPPSVYSTHTASSEDVRGRDGRPVSRRISIVADPAKQISLQPPFNPHTSFNPYAWTNVPPVPAVPIVYGMPFYGMDMPLLPPSPPFMMNQYGALPRSYTGSQAQQSPRQSSSSLPRNHSSEAVSQGSRNSSPHSNGFQPAHQRRPSAEAVTPKPLGDRRSGSHGGHQMGRPAVITRPAHLQGSPQRSSWVTPGQNQPSSVMKSSPSRPFSTTQSSHPPSTRRRTAAS